MNTFLRRYISSESDPRLLSEAGMVLP